MERPKARKPHVLSGLEAILICTLDDKNYCSRHRRIHPAFEIATALEDSEQAEAIRQKWDRLAAMPAMQLPEKKGCGCAPKKEGMPKHP